MSVHGGGGGWDNDVTYIVTKTIQKLPSVVHLSRVTGASVFPPRASSLTDVISKTNKSCLHACMCERRQRERKGDVSVVV